MFSKNVNITEFLKNIFGWKVGKSEITLFSLYHIGYILVIAGLIVGSAFLLKNKKQNTKRKVLNIIAITTLSLYIFDFIIQPFTRADFTMDIDKLPFHICTLMGINCVFAQFSKKQWFKETSVTLAIIGSFIYLIYPGSALGNISPWCYRVIQTFLYHGLLLAWGVLNLTTGEVKLSFKHIWYNAIALCVVTAWATLGNMMFNGGPSHYDWLFITGSTFDFFPATLMPIIAIAILMISACLLYLIYMLFTFKKKKTVKKATNKK